MLLFRPYKECDAPAIASWIRDEYSFRKWCADRFDSFPLTPDALNAHYAASKDTDNIFPFTAYDKKGVAGHLILRFTDDTRKDVRLGFIIVDYDRRGTGLGKEMVLLAQRYAFEFLGAEKVSLAVFDNNPAAYHCYYAAGFREVPDETDSFFETMGEKWKRITMELTRQQYENR